MPTEGDMAPGFTLAGVDRDGGAVEVSLDALRGQRVVLYFYPKDDTSGCTTQACDIRDEWSRFREAGPVVLGVSPDDLESHRRFGEKHQLPFTLLSDPDHAVARKYDVWKEKSMYGRKYWGIERSTFVIGPDGRIEAALRKVRPKAHADQVLELLSETA